MHHSALSFISHSIPVLILHKYLQKHTLTTTASSNSSWLNMDATKKLGSSQLLSKLATSDQHGENSPYFDGWKAYDKDRFHPTTNPNGVIQMGLAENQLMLDGIEEWIKKHPEASICSSEGVHEFKDIALFQDYHGLPRFRQGVARFMGKARGGRVSLDPDRIVMAGGATGANEMLMFCLADSGDGFLVLSPYYPAFDRDLGWRPEVQLLPVKCESSNNFQITKEALEEAYQNAQKANIKVKGIILSNPSNPLGTTMDKATLRTLVTFINHNQIHLVCDEIYAATVFRSPQFVSISEVVAEMDCNLDLIHVVYSLSKDMGVPGLRVGILYSYNDRVVTRGRQMSSFGLISSQTQHWLAAMLCDEKFTDRYLSESTRRLASRHDKFTKGLKEVGIECLESNAGLYCWMDLRQLLKEPTFDGEMGLWRVIINEVKLNISPGSSFHCNEPGWFRICFANMDDVTLDIALKRIGLFVRKGGKEVGDSIPANPSAAAPAKGLLGIALAAIKDKLDEWKINDVVPNSARVCFAAIWNGTILKKGALPKFGQIAPVAGAIMAFFCAGYVFKLIK